jgi:hypothetical protein
MRGLSPAGLEIKRIAKNRLDLRVRNRRSCLKQALMHVTVGHPLKKRLRTVAQGIHNRQTSHNNTALTEGLHAYVFPFKCLKRK